jgi:hypothetical protein
MRPDQLQLVTHHFHLPNIRPFITKWLLDSVVVTDLITHCSIGVGEKTTKVELANEYVMHAISCWHATVNL